MGAIGYLVKLSTYICDFLASIHSHPPCALYFVIYLV